MKRIIMTMALIATVVFSNNATGQGKGVQTQNVDVRTGNDMPAERQANRLQQQREGRDPNSAAAPVMNQDTTRPRRDTMRSPQPVPPTPPVPMPPDTLRKK